MRKTFLIDTPVDNRPGFPHRQTRFWGVFAGICLFHVSLFLMAGLVGADEKQATESSATDTEQNANTEQNADTEQKADPEQKADAKQDTESSAAETIEASFPADYWSQAKSPVYPRGVAFSTDQVFIVDSDAPGVWALARQEDQPGSPELFATGSRYLRKIMNRPFSATAHPDKGVLVGDAATREIYHVTTQPDAPAGQDAKPLNNGYLGIPMALAVSPDKKSIYVGDAERRAVFVLPITGGKPELVVRVNARGLAFDAAGQLWAVTPDADAVMQIDVSEKKAKPIVTDRPYGFPGGIAWLDDGDQSIGYVSDVYGKCIWSFTADGKTEKWFEGEPLVGPVGLAVTQTAVWVSDPKTKQIYRIDRESKQAQAMFAN